MLESILFKSVQLVMPEGFREGDVFVQHGKIVEVGPSISRSAELVISEKGLALLPGVIDPHVHFRDPGLTWKEDISSGSKAAAAGGVTSFFDMPNTTPSCTTPALMAEKKRIAAEHSWVNYNFFIGATADNIDDINSIENIPGIKLYMGPSTGELLLDDLNAISLLFQNAKHLIAVHAEDGETITRNKAALNHPATVYDHYNIRSAEAARKATACAITLSKKFNRRLHICHMTTQEEAKLLAAERDNPLITCEVTPQHLLLQAPEAYDRLGTCAQMNPPIREARHRLALVQALRAGTINCIATDHAPHTIEEKQLPYGKAPSGMPGVETSLSLMLTEAYFGRVSYAQVIQWMCQSPARLFNIPEKGDVRVGYDADLAIVDLNKRRVLSNSAVVSKCGWTPFDGTEVVGVPVMTVVNGQLVFREGDFLGEPCGREIVIPANVI